MSGKLKNVKEFYLEDYQGTLFPMNTCRYVIERSPEKISEYLSKIAKDEFTDFCFLPQETVYASKANHHQRRTLKLDPVATFYMYDLVYRNRKIFRKSNDSKRKNFGYRFVDSKVIPTYDSYNLFNEKANLYKLKYKYYIKFDISAYFNSIYHHDITNWLSDQKIEDGDGELFNRFMREINSGNSIDFMPQGLYPSKMLGSHFLSYIDHSKLVKCEQMIRFMDDFIIFSDDKDILFRDFQTIQKALGQKSLNLNTQKTIFFSDSGIDISNEVGIIENSFWEDFQLDTGYTMGYEIDDNETIRDLSSEERDYLLTLIDSDRVADKDASLVIDFIYKYTSDFYRYVPNFIYRFPFLANKIFYKCSLIKEYEQLSEALKGLLESLLYLNEYQLFWITHIVESYLLKTRCGGSLLALLYEHKNSTNISKAKILEIPEQRFGMPEWREEHLKNGSSGWLAWSSAVGMRNSSKQARNYMLGYSSKSSNINKLIADSIKKY